MPSLNTLDVQGWMFAHELEHAEPAALARRIARLGMPTVSLAVTYHRARLVLPGTRSAIRSSPGGAVFFEPHARRYSRLRPRRTASQSLVRALHKFRDACRREGVQFRAWVIALHNEPLVASTRTGCAEYADGSRSTISLCPSHPLSISYVSELLTDIAFQLEPSAIDLEAAVYPAWEPSYGPTISVTKITSATQLLATQCFCVACRTLMSEHGLDAGMLRGALLAALGTPFGRGRQQRALPLPKSVVEALATARSAGVRRLLEAAKGALSGTALHVYGYGRADVRRLQGFTLDGLRPADRVSVGLASRAGTSLENVMREEADRFRPMPVMAGLTIRHGQSERAIASDLNRLYAAGAVGVSLYNLSLLDDRARRQLYLALNAPYEPA